MIGTHDGARRSSRLRGTALRRIAILASVSALFAITWLFGMFGFGRITEDMCFDDLATQPRYGAYSMTVQSWPPSVVCRLRGDAVPDLVVNHYGRGAFYAAWTTVVPLVMVGSVIGLGLAMRRRPPFPSGRTRSIPADRSGTGR